MWLSVDRIEDQDMVVLVADDEAVHHLSAEAYTALVGRPPKANAMLDARIESGVIVSAVYSGEETERRLAAARERLTRLTRRNHT